MKNFPYILNEKIKINGRNIYCKVTGEPGSANDGQPYIVVVTGGPGFGHELSEASIKKIIPLAQQEKRALPHFIFFDNLGCGQSDKAHDPDSEYTVDHFTDLTADLVKAVKNKLKLPKMNLYVEGGSFGSMVAMNMPARKPAWVQPDSDIHLKQVTAKVVVNGANEAPYTFNFLQKHYSDHPNYIDIVNAQKKLYSGDILDQKDFLNFALTMSSLYVKDINQSWVYKTIKNLVVRYPNAVLTTLSLTNRFLKWIGLPNDSIDFADNAFGKCSIDVLNHFFKKDFDGYNLIETVKQNKKIYEQIAICMISASEDHIVDYRTALTINEGLPNSSAAIILKGPHMVSKGPGVKIYDKLVYDLFVTGVIPKSDVTDPIIFKQTMSDAFQKMLSAAHDHLSSSTKKLFVVMPKQQDSTREIELLENSISGNQENLQKPWSLPQVTQATVIANRPGF